MALDDQGVGWPPAWVKPLAFILHAMMRDQTVVRIANQILNRQGAL